MILSQPDLRAALQRKEIGFTPELEETQWGEASIDLRLGFSFTQIRPAPGITISVAQGLSTLGEMKLLGDEDLREADEFGKPEAFTLGPGEFILALRKVDGRWLIAADIDNSNSRPRPNP